MESDHAVSCGNFARYQTGGLSVNLTRANLSAEHDPKQSVNLTVKSLEEPLKSSNGCFQCAVPNCKISCKRKWDLRRHEATVHRVQKAYWCPVLECDRSNHHHVVDRPFPRRDKRDEHFRKVHKKKIPEISISPTPSCVPEPTPEFLQDSGTERRALPNFDGFVDPGSPKSSNTTASGVTTPTSIAVTTLSFDSNAATSNPSFIQGEIQMNQGISIGYDMSLFPQLTDVSSPKHIETLTAVHEEFQPSTYEDVWSSLNMDPVGIQYGLGTETLWDDLDAFLPAAGDNT